MTTVVYLSIKGDTTDSISVTTKRNEYSTVRGHEALRFGENYFQKQFAKITCSLFPVPDGATGKSTESHWKVYE